MTTRPDPNFQSRIVTCRHCGRLMRVTDGRLPQHDTDGTSRFQCAGSRADVPPTEAEVQAALDFGRTADQHLPH